MNCNIKLLDNIGAGNAEDNASFIERYFDDLDLNITGLSVSINRLLNVAKHP